MKCNNKAVTTRRVSLCQTEATGIGQKGERLGKQLFRLFRFLTELKLSAQDFSNMSNHCKRTKVTGKNVLLEQSRRLLLLFSPGIVRFF